MKPSTQKIQGNKKLYMNTECFKLEGEYFEVAGRVEIGTVP